MLGLRGRLVRLFGGSGCELVEWNWGVIMYLPTVVCEGCRYGRIAGAYWVGFSVLMCMNSLNKVFFRCSIHDSAKKMTNLELNQIRCM
jgi:hypothetical protein